MIAALGGVAARVVGDAVGRRVVLRHEVVEVLAHAARRRGSSGWRSPPSVVALLRDCSGLAEARRAAADDPAVEDGVEVVDGDVVLLRVLVDEREHRPGVRAPGAAEEDDRVRVRRVLEQVDQLGVGDLVHAPAAVSAALSASVTTGTFPPLGRARGLLVLAHVGLGLPPVELVDAARGSRRRRW